MLCNVFVLVHDPNIQWQEITERAMNGELDFAASLRERVSLLKGVPADVFEKLKSVLTISPGAREVCKALKRLGCKLAVLSGGFQPLAEWLAGELGIDYAFANHVRFNSLLADPPKYSSVFVEYSFSLISAVHSLRLTRRRKP